MIKLRFMPGREEYVLPPSRTLAFAEIRPVMKRSRGRSRDTRGVWEGKEGPAEEQAVVVER